MTLQPLTKFLFITLFFTSVLFSQNLQEIHVSTSDPFLQRVSKNFPFPLDKISKKEDIAGYTNELTALYMKDFGYFAVKEISALLTYNSDSSSFVINLSIDPGQRAILKEIAVQDTLLSEIKYMTDDLAGEPYDKFNIEEAVHQALKTLELKGYPFAAIIIKRVTVADDSVTVYLGTESGPAGTIYSIEISGNSLTDPEVIIRELRLRQGENYTDELARRIPPRLNRLRLFDQVEVPSFYYNSKNEGVLSITLKEKQFNNFDGIIGYIPPGKNEKDGYITGLLNIAFRNIFGTGRMAGFRWQRIDRYSQELELKYMEPWVLSYPINVNAALFQRKQDTTYVQLKYDFSIDYMLNENITLSWLVGIESIVPTLKDSLTLFTVYNSSYFNNGVEASYDSRNDPYVPVSGMYVRTSFSLAQKRINGPAEFIFPGQQVSLLLRKTQTQLLFFVSTFRRQVIAIKTRYQEISGDNLELNELFRLGGNNDLRGYRENQFFASRILVANLEYRFLTGGRTFIFPFFDAGYYKREANAASKISADQALKFGYGVGLYLETGAGMLRVEYGLAKGDSFSQGKIHFGIVSDF